jgi:acyl carrier protein
MSERLERMQTVMRDIFDEPALVVSPATSAADVEGWDSLSHISLVVAMEKEFGVRFDLRELRSLKNVGEWDELIGRKLG